MGKLTTHVLDLARGRPAVGIRLDLWQLDLATDQRVLLCSVRTNSDGRTDQPLLHGDDFRPGTYELVFHVGDYFRDFPTVTDPPFLSTVPVRFTVTDATAAYHVPLLVAPWGYSTYRGS